MIPKVSKSERCKAEHRDILASILKSDKSARAAYAHLMRCGAKDIRPDYMLVRNESGTYDRLPDFGAWNAYIPRFGGMSACMLRGRDGVWFLNS